MESSLRHLLTSVSTIINLWNRMAPPRPMLFFEGAADVEPSAFAQTIRMLVFLPLLGLKNGFDSSSVDIERSVLQSWSLIAQDINSSHRYSANSSLRIVGMVEAKEHCDPWIESRVRPPAPSSYSCHVLPQKCLHSQYEDIPMVDCLFATAIGLAEPGELVAFANGDIIFTPAMIPAVSALYHDYRAGGSNNTHASSFVVVGRRMDVDRPQEEIPVVLSADTVVTLQEVAAKNGVLHSDWGMDYFIFSSHAFPSDFPSFLVGRCRWDNALFISFLLAGVTTIDATDTIMAIHWNLHPIDNGTHMARFGADYNDNLAWTTYGLSIEFGRSSYTDLLQVEGGYPGTYSLVPREPDDIVTAFKRSHIPPEVRGEDRSFMLLVSMLPGQEAEARRWANAAAQLGVTNYMLLAFGDSSFEALRRELDGAVMPMRSNTYFMFIKRLLSMHVAVALLNLMEAVAWIQDMPPGSDRIWEVFLPSDCDIIFKDGSYQDLRAIRPTAAGKVFLDKFESCQSSKEGPNKSVFKKALAIAVAENDQRSLVSSHQCLQSFFQAAGATSKEEGIPRRCSLPAMGTSLRDIQLGARQLAAAPSIYVYNKT